MGGALIITGLIAFLLGAALSWLVAKNSASKTMLALQNENVRLQTVAENTNTRLTEQQKFLEDAQSQMKDAFGALSARALQNNNASFMSLATARLDEKMTEAKGELEKKEQAIGELVKPLGESLKNMDTKIHDLESKRIRAYSDIWNYLDQMKLTAEGLKKETTSLVGALKTSHTRGRYGELALRRLVEHAGMLEHCDFEEQVNVEDESGRLRPDMIIKLPGSKTLVVDSKAPLSAYMRMFESEDEQEQKLSLSQHVAAVRDHLKKLSAKAYWSQFADAPDFVIMYIQIESSYGVALQAYPEMIEEAMKNRIIIATPTVLLSILMGVGYSWNQLKTMENIEAIKDAAIELHDRSAILLEHMANIGKSLNNTITHYNKTVGSLEGNFLPAARKINTLSQAYVKKELPETIPVETSVRTIASSTLPSEDIANQQ
jgi:DNA recombination protein RmuC